MCVVYIGLLLMLMDGLRRFFTVAIRVGASKTAMKSRRVIAFETQLGGTHFHGLRISPKQCAVHYADGTVKCGLCGA